MSEKLTKLVIEIECGPIFCEKCQWLWDFWTIKRELSCLLFINKRGDQRRLGHYKTQARRCAACLEAEHRAKGGKRA